MAPGREEFFTSSLLPVRSGSRWFLVRSDNEKIAYARCKKLNCMMCFCKK